MEVTYKHLEHCFDNYINLNYFADWFDNELKRNFNIDVMRQEIDNTQPFFTFNNDKASVILIKCEQLSSLDKEIGDFLNVDNFVLKNSNEAKNKWYSNIHQYFKQHYDFLSCFTCMTYRFIAIFTRSKNEKLSNQVVKNSRDKVSMKKYCILPKPLVAVFKPHCTAMYIHLDMNRMNTFCLLERVTMI